MFNSEHLLLHLQQFNFRSLSILTEDYVSKFNLNIKFDDPNKNIEQKIKIIQIFQINFKTGLYQKQRFNVFLIIIFFIEKHNI